MKNAVRLLTGTSTALTMALLPGLGYGAILTVVRGPMRRVGAARMAATRETARLLGEALSDAREVKL